MKIIDIIKKFAKNHPIIFNLLLIVITFLVICYMLLLYLDSFTEHNKYRVVPDVKNMTLNDAISKLQSEGFKWEVTDSVFNESFAPGTVTEQSPKENSKVKSNRTIYVCINAFSPRLVAFPDINDMSERQAQSRLIGLGFRNISVENVYSPYKGLVLDCKINGLPIAVGTKIPSSSNITLMVGDGAETIDIDSLNVDSMSMVEMIDEFLQ